MADDWFAQNAPQSSSGSGDWFEQNSPNNRFVANPGKPYGEFFGGLYRNTIGAIPGMVSEFVKGEAPNVPTKPFDPRGFIPPGVGGITRLLGDVAQSQYETGKKAFAPGISTPERIGYGAAALLPLVGPPAAHAGELIGSGNVAGGLGEATGLVAPFAAKAMASAIPHVVPDAIPENLGRSAVESYSRALAPTKEKFKAMTEKVVAGTPGNPSLNLPPTPGLIDRGVTAYTRRGLQSKFANMVDAFGNQIDALQAKIPPGSKYIPYSDVQDAIQKGLDERFTVETKYGPVPAGPHAMVGLNTGAKLKQMLMAAREVDPSGTPVIDYQILRRFKQNWDDSIADAGGFANKDFVNNAKMGAYKEAANAIRGQLNSATPDIAAINREFSFWKNAKDVIDETVKRTSAQSQPMGEQLAKVAGQAAGAATGSAGKVVLLGETLRNLRKFTTSTGWNTIGAVAKDRLANFLATGNNNAANALMNTLMATPKPSSIPPLSPPPQ